MIGRPTLRGVDARFERLLSETDPPNPPFLRGGENARRRGFTLVEAMITGVLLGVLMMIVTPLLGVVIKQRQAAERRLVAHEEVANVMERLTQQSWDELTPEKAKDVTVSSAAAALLDDAELAVTVTAVDESPAAKRVAVELKWIDSGRNAAAPVRLTSWVYRQEGR